jgi:hypothetical protein
MSSISCFTLHNNRGQSVLNENLLGWRDDLHHPSGIFGPVVRHSWKVGEDNYESFKGGFWRLLPLNDGFIVFENTKTPNNCLLLDAYGNERVRLTVPWQLAGITDPAAREASEFDNVSEPYLNPLTGEKGQFGVTGWIGQAKYYFELDYKKASFLWCVRIRD